jgi:ribonucleoside-triphosphate reductase
MRNLEDIEKELAAAKEARYQVKGTPAEVYSRIVGYYRSVRNWNKGKREEYGERRLYEIFEAQIAEKQIPVSITAFVPGTANAATPFEVPQKQEEAQRILLFVRPTCPACPPAKDAAGRLGIPVDLVNTDTEDGLAEAARHNVMSTPTAILIARDGVELGRARDSGSIAAFGKQIAV